MFFFFWFFFQVQTLFNELSHGSLGGSVGLRVWGVCGNGDSGVCKVWVMGRDGERRKHYQKNCMKNSKNNETVLKIRTILSNVCLLFLNVELKLLSYKSYKGHTIPPHCLNFMFSLSPKLVQYKVKLLPWDSFSFSIWL